MSGAISAVAVGGLASALGASTAVAIGAGLAAGNMVSTYKGAKKQAKAIEQGNQIAVAQAKEAKAQQEQAFRAKSDGSVRRCSTVRQLRRTNRNVSMRSEKGCAAK